MKLPQISIIGCGWLGLPLANKLIELGYTVKGTTTSESKLLTLKSYGILPYIITLNEKRIEGNITDVLLESDILIINIPPGLRQNPEKNHVAEINTLISEIEKSTIKKVLFISSTSVFEDSVDIPIISEHSKPNGTSNSAKQLIEIEDILLKNCNFKSTILRFSGLIGKDRHPGKFLSGRTNVANPNAPVNLIHREDCIGIILKLITCDIWSKTYNACFPSHPTKSKYYLNYCKTNHLDLPQFDFSSPSKGKKIDGNKVAQLLSFEYKNGL